MTKEETLEATAPYHGLIYSIVDEAWAEWRSVQTCRADKNFGPLLYPRVIANYVHDAIARRAIPAFSKEPKVTVRVEAQTFKLLFGGVVARFKKGDENNLSSNVETFAAMAFESQNEVIPGLPPEITKVDFIWRPNDYGTEIDQVLIVSRDGDEILWEHEIDAPVVAVDKSVMNFGSDFEEDNDEQNLIKPKSMPAESIKED